MIVVRTPLRVSLLGGGTDFPDFYAQDDGHVLATTIDKYIYVVLNQRHDDRIRVSYSQTELVQDIAQLQHDLVREALRHVGISGGVEVATLADIPTRGSGLGSSSSLTVGLLVAFWRFLGREVDSHQLAEAACDVEIVRLGRPIGKQDQYLAAYGGLRFVTFTADRVEVANATDDAALARKLIDRLMLFYSGDVGPAEDCLCEQQSSIEDHRRDLRQLAKLACQAREALEQRNLDAIGELIHDSWQIKRQLARGITNSLIDEMYARAREAGAIGGKICGAGGRGYLLLYVRPRDRRAVRKALAEHVELCFRGDRHGCRLLVDARPIRARRSRFSARLALEESVEAS